MTTQVTIINSGPKTVSVTGGCLTSPLEIASSAQADAWVATTPLQIVEVDDPTLGGGHGEEGG